MTKQKRNTRPPGGKKNLKTLKRDAIKRDPRLKKKLAATPDHDVKSYIRGWFNPTFK